jgi:hypothetical protein
MTDVLYQPLLNEGRGSFLSVFGMHGYTDKFIGGLDRLMPGAGKRVDLDYEMGTAKGKAIEYARRYKELYHEVFIAPRYLQEGNITDIAGNKIFKGNGNRFGWLRCVDEDILANWGHDCRYIFFMNEYDVTEQTAQLPPDPIINLEAVE